MGFNYLLLWIVGVSLVATAYRSLAVTGQTRGDSQDRSSANSEKLLALGLSLGLFACLWLFVYVIPAWSGFAIALLWFLFMLAPGLAFRRVQSLLSAQRAFAARPYAIFARLFYPVGHFKELPALVEAFSLAQSGEEQKAQSAFARLESSSHSQVRQLATAHRFSSVNDWEGLCRWYQDMRSKSEQGTASAIAPLFLRALGETRRYSQMINEFMQLDPALRAASAGPTLRQSQLIFFAFLGQTNFVRWLLDNFCSKLPKDVKLSWLGVAEQSAGNFDQARTIFESLKNSELAIVRNRAAAQLSSQVTPPILDPESQFRLDQYLAFAEQEFLSSSRSDPAFTPLMSYVLIGLNCIMYGVQIVVGATVSVEALITWGALFPPSVYILGEWWRVITAGFLHAGLAHLLTNMLGIYILGPYVEQRLGRVRFLITFLGSSALSLSAIVLMTYLQWQAPTLVVGASAGVLGLVGSTACVLLIDWLKDKHPSTAQRLKSIGFIITIQVVFDLSTPQVSFSGHLGGLLSGLLITAMLMVSKKTLKPN